MSNEELSSYNRYLTEGIIDGTIKEILKDGVRVYLVRRPLPNEEVVGYINFSSFLVTETPTNLARQDDV